MFSLLSFDIPNEKRALSVAKKHIWCSILQTVMNPVYIHKQWRRGWTVNACMTFYYWRLSFSAARCLGGLWERFWNRSRSEKKTILPWILMKVRLPLLPLLPPFNSLLIWIFHLILSLFHSSLSPFASQLHAFIVMLPHCCTAVPRPPAPLPW